MAYSALVLFTLASSALEYIRSSVPDPQFTFTLAATVLGASILTFPLSLLKIIAVRVTHDIFSNHWLIFIQRLVSRNHQPSRYL